MLGEVSSPLMALSDTDSKLLWARAGGICSFPECRENLVKFSKARQNLFHIGEGAHMIARRIGGPRGESKVGRARRDSYENHILLCPKCHTLIDKAPADYPVAVLKRLKLHHETWVGECLALRWGKLSESTKFYRLVIRRVEHALWLGRWSWLIDNLWRDLMPFDLQQAISEVGHLRMATLWPGTRTDLERAIRNLLEAWLAYWTNFMERGEVTHSGKFLRGTRPRLGAGQDAIEAENNWSNRNGRLLWNYVYRLNIFVDAVRSSVNLGYRQKAGYFLIHDDLGYRHGGVAVDFLPDGLKPIDDDGSRGRGSKLIPEARRRTSPVSRSPHSRSPRRKGAK
jgi:hypothetical protein